MDISSALYGIGHYNSSFVKGIKCALSIARIISSDYIEYPFHCFRTSERGIVLERMKQLELLS